MTVEVHLSGLLAARAGTSRTYVSVPEDATVADVIDRLAERYGRALRSALADGDRLRGDATARRRGNVTDERLSLHSRVAPGDRLEFGARTGAGTRTAPAQSASRFNA